MAGPTPFTKTNGAAMRDTRAAGCSTNPEAARREGSNEGPRTALLHNQPGQLIRTCLRGRDFNCRKQVTHPRSAPVGCRPVRTPAVRLLRLVQQNRLNKPVKAGLSQRSSRQFNRLPSTSRLTCIAHCRPSAISVSPSKECQASAEGMSQRRMISRRQAVVILVLACFNRVTRITS
jgi:hypothetical protein